MFTSKRILGIVIGAFVALLIASGATSTTGATAVPEPDTFMPAEADDSLARCGKCGDNYCNPRCGETATSCPRDCGGTTSAVEQQAAAGACGKCGDNVCNPRCGETATSCPKDCGSETSRCDELASTSACGKCGDNVCNPRCGETATSCPRDCGVSA